MGESPTRVGLSGKQYTGKASCVKRRGSVSTGICVCTYEFKYFPFWLAIHIYIITAVNVLGDFGLPYVPCTAVKAFCCLWLAIHIVPRVTLWRGWLAIQFGKVFDAIGLPYAKRFYF